MCAKIKGLLKKMILFFRTQKYLTLKYITTNITLLTFLLFVCYQFEQA